MNDLVKKIIEQAISLDEKEVTVIRKDGETYKGIVSGSYLIDLDDEFAEFDVAIKGGYSIGNCHYEGMVLSVDNIKYIEGNVINL